MKRLKKLFVSIVALAMLVCACFSLTACADIKTVEITVSVVDTSTSTLQDKTLKVDLYRHLAPKTVDKMVEYINAGYYNDAVFYHIENKVLMGDLAYENGKFVQKEIKPAIYGEFDRNGTVGSNLLNKEGSIGLWRTWTADTAHTTNTSAFDSGRATWFMPTTDITNYNDYFCVFAQINLEDETNKATWEAISDLFSSETTYEKYTIYYTGSYDAEKVNENYGLTFNCVPSADFNADEIDNLFVAEGEQLVAYNKTEIRAPFFTTSSGTKLLGAKITKAIVK